MKTIDLDKWSRLARYHEKLPDNVVRCHVCPHNCLVYEGKYGFCQTRVNYQGEVILPEGLTGTFGWKGQTIQLKGKTNIDLL